MFRCRRPGGAQARRRAPGFPSRSGRCRSRGCRDTPGRASAADPSPSRSTGPPRSTRPSSSAPATTWPRTVSPMPSSGCRAASTPPSSPPSPSTRWGPASCTGCSMPSRYSSEGSISDAAELATRLGIDLGVVSIEAAHVAMAELLAPLLGGPAHGSHRREPAIAPAGPDADGRLQCQGLDRPDHGEQERDGDGLLHPVRRLGRGVRGDQGRPQDARVRALPPPERRGRATGRSGPSPRR